MLKTYIEDVVDVPSRTVLKTNGNNLVCLVVDQDAPPTVCDVSCSAHFLRFFQSTTIKSTDRCNSDYRARSLQLARACTVRLELLTHTCLTALCLGLPG